MKEKRYKFGIKKFVKYLWRRLRLDEFDKYFIGALFVIIIFLIFIEIFETFFGFTFLTDILNNQLEWISRKFSVPLTQDKLFSFSVDAFDILSFFIIFIILFIIMIGWPIKKLIKSRFKRNK